MSPIIVRNFIDKETAEHHAKRMDETLSLGTYDDGQAPKSWSWYGLQFDLLEEKTEHMCELTGVSLLPSYDYCRLYYKGSDLKPHTDRGSCEVSVTVNLKNVEEPWEFFWEGGSCKMDQGDAVIYLGREIKHWREENTFGTVYQSFLHYVDAEGPFAENANEYMIKYMNVLKSRGIIPVDK